MIRKILVKIEQLFCKHNTRYIGQIKTWIDDRLYDVVYEFQCKKCGKHINIKSSKLIPEIEKCDNYRCAKKLVKMSEIVEDKEEK